MVKKLAIFPSEWLALTENGFTLLSLDETTQCENYRILPLWRFGENSVKSTFLLNAHQVNCNVIWRNIFQLRAFSIPCNTHCLWKLQNFTATIFSQKFRQINFLPKKFTLNCFDGKKIAWQRFFCFSTLCNTQ